MTAATGTTAHPAGPVVAAGTPETAPAGPGGAPESASALVERRLAALRGEYDNGQARLAELELQEARLRERLLMLRGAIQALDGLQGDLAPGSR
jgi:hypothetical protein